MNVFEFAMKMEVDGKAYYEQMAAATSQPGLRSIFTQLAEDEQKHFETFVALNDGRSAKMAATSILDGIENVFSRLTEDASALGKELKDLDAYQHAMKLESDSFRFYEEIAEKEQDSKIKELLLQIAGEEHKHFNLIANLFNFINAPNEYLAWREFSNLDEFHQFGRDVDA